MAEYVDYIPMNLSDPTIQPNNGTRQSVEPGTYTFEVEKAVFDQSRKGNRTLKITAKIMTEGPMKGRNLVASYVVADDDFSRQRMKAIVVATQAPLDEQGGFSREALIGLQFEADVILDSFDAINEKSGLTEKREITKWIGERPLVEQDAPVVHAAKPAAAPAQRPAVDPAAAAAAAAANGPRRPVPPAAATNGAARRA